MSEFKLCKNGHYYQNALEECPYCPRPGGYHTGPNQLKNTVMSDLNQSDWDHTRIETSLPEAPPPTLSPIPVSPPSPVTPAAVPPPSFSPPGAPPALARTQLYAPEGTPGRPDDRKLVGWLVSYTHTPTGADFRVYEGRNSLGADPGCDIVVPNDPAVSARHLTLLYRADGFRFKDELSTNGTFINEVMRDEGLLHDGDQIRVGSTVFKFRSAL
ncbi:MAG: FHA domain-containing protein [Cytophagales bacterium]|nr:FHA domain-containing protein [Cytophagales bacterium]